ncbi:MAG: gamma-glutamyltranspeptidase/glutathione hydrolase [Pirellulaceae bacterium]|jgi:gamma-glutamyltranspeptidase/glutathione hydrolase
MANFRFDAQHILREKLNMKRRRTSDDSDSYDLSQAGDIQPQRVSVSAHGMVASQHYLATEAGSAILERGGNAIDAAVATAFALGVCEPAASGLGGQTMMLVHTVNPRRTFAVDGSSHAPSRATPELFDGARGDTLRGHRATTVPSTVATLGYVLERYGSLPMAQILEPSIQFAEQGYPVSKLQHALTKREQKHLRQGTAGQFFLSQTNRVMQVGSSFRQHVLADTLRRIALKGTDEFYRGEIADAIHQDMLKNDGLIQHDDLANIPRPIERRPVSCKFQNLRVLTMPPPGAGRSLVQILNVISQFSEKQLDIETPEGVNLMCEIIRRAFWDRGDRPMDAEFFPQVENERMLDPEYAAEVAKQIRRRIKTQGETTHLSVMDKEGNSVALTQSIERVYGSCAASPELGFLYNNYMSAFDFEDINHPYYLRPNASPWASVAPTIVFRGRRPWLVIGSPGSERIAPSVAQVLLRLLFKKRNPYDAVAAARFYCDLTGKVSLEASRMRSDIVDYLTDRGYEISIRDPFSFYLGCVQLVVNERKMFTGVADPRRDGAAKGPRQ